MTTPLTQASAANAVATARTAIPRAVNTANAVITTNTGRGRLVTDAPTRMAHVLMALSFTGAYLTAESEHWRAWHVAQGYALAGLLALRVGYGWLGPRSANLVLVFRKLAAAPAWARAVAQAVQGLDFGAVQRQLQAAQNLVVALAIVSLLVLVAPLAFSGHGSYNDWGDVLGGELWPETHEFLGEAMLVAVLAHVGLVAGLSLLRRKNLAQRMLSGRVEGAGPDLVKHNRRWLAVLLLAAYVAFVVGFVLSVGSDPTGA